MADVSSPAARYAARLLACLGLPGAPGDDHDPVVDWASSGAMALTGHPDGPPLVSTGPAVALRGALLALQALSPGTALPGLALLSERAALTGAGRQGSRSCGGASRLLPAADGQVAVTLARPDDVDLVPALVEGEVTGDPWDAVTSWLARHSTAKAAERLALLGIPYGVAGEATAELPWLTTHEQLAAPVHRTPVVLNLGALWAGPLCASLLGATGCRVVKVEDVRRPDGARRGPAAFFAQLNAGAEQVTLDLATAAGREQLGELIASADVVLEGSRPRALQQLGFVAHELVETHPGLTWVSITGHGRASDRVGFGDDAAVAGGLVRDGCFVGDAIADPMTGVHAALAARAGLLRGGSRLVDVALSRVAATAAHLDLADPRAAFLREGRWHVESAQGAVPVADPQRRLK
jgi:hypothetical protein